MIQWDCHEWSFTLCLCFFQTTLTIWATKWPLLFSQVYSNLVPHFGRRHLLRCTQHLDHPGSRGGGWGVGWRSGTQQAFVTSNVTMFMNLIFLQGLMTLNLGLLLTRLFIRFPILGQVRNSKWVIYRNRFMYFKKMGNLGKVLFIKMFIMRTVKYWEKIQQKKKISHRTPVWQNVLCLLK